MDKSNQDYALELLLLIRQDISKQNELKNLEEYDKDLEKIHLENAEKLRIIITKIGWPTIRKVGYEANKAAMMILHNAISCPKLYYEALPLLIELANKKEIASLEAAIIYDRICYFEMRPQKYGTQFDYDHNEELNPWEIEDYPKVDVYRNQVGLPPLDEAIKKIRTMELKKPLNTNKERIKARHEWAKTVGWIQ